MELTRFHQCVDDEFLETETDVREIWWALCRDFDVPKERWLGPDL